MPVWLRNLVMLVGLAGWVSVVATYLIKGQLPDAALLGVPAFLVLALAPPKLPGTNSGGAESEPPAPPTPPTPVEETAR